MSAALAAVAMLTAAAQAQPMQSMQPGQMPMGRAFAPNPMGVQRYSYIGGMFAISGPGADGSLEFVGPMTGLIAGVGPMAAGMTPGYSTQSGIRVTLQPQWQGSYGYVPILVTAKLAKAATSDRRIAIRFGVGDYRSNGDSMNVRSSLVLPQGQTSASTKLLVPRYESWHLCGWEIVVDGRKDDDLSLERTEFPGTGHEGHVAVMTSPDAGPSVEPMISAILSGNSILVKSTPPEAMPAEWIEYTPFDLVVLSADELASLARRRPQQMAALRRWVRAGGNLWVMDVGRNWENLAETEQAMAVDEESTNSSVPEEDKIDDRQLAARGWRPAPLGDRPAELVESVAELSDFKGLAQTRPRWGGGGNGTIGVFNRTAGDSSKWFVVRGLGLGVVAAFRGELEGGFQRQDQYMMSVVAQSLLAPRLSWTGRFGLQPDQYNVEFNNLLIPDVGVAPVGQFQVLISLFVIAIGPLNYWLLKRKNKLPLLLFTVPVAAAATTVLLFAYGLLADGVGVRTRSRSFTMLDQKAGEAVSWARSSYYAGIAPREGLVVPRDAALFPILPRWGTESGLGRRGATQRREIVWRDRQQLVRGWLSSRTPTQYLNIAARATKKRLDLRPTAKGLRVVNRLGVDVAQLAVQDHSGKFYWCENLAAGEGGVFPVVTQRTVSSNVRRLFLEHALDYPAGAEQPDYTGNIYGFQITRNLMEGHLEAIGSPLATGWGAGSYVAFTNRGVELDLGVDSAAEEASFHVIQGEW